MFARPNKRTQHYHTLCVEHMSKLFFFAADSTPLSHFMCILFSFGFRLKTHFAELQRFSSEQQSSLSGHEAQRLPESGNNVEPWNSLGVQKHDAQIYDNKIIIIKNTE